MRILKTSLLAATAILAAFPSVAGAQDIVMRRPIPMSMVVDGGASWKTTPWIIFDASNTAIDVKDACGDYVERRTVYCGKADGSKIEELYCRAQEKPIAERPARHDEGCTYSWSTSEWRDPGASCSLKEPQSRDVKCLRDTDKVVMAERFCSGAKPDTDRTVEDFATCTYTWKTGEFVDPGASCTNTEKQDRKVWCERDLDTTVATSESLCDPSKRPASSQSVRDISACTYSWKAAPFVDPGDSCTRSETQTRAITCHRSLNDELADDAACKASDKPTTTQTVEDYKTCSFKAVQPGEWSWSSTCSATAVKTRTYKCQRSNDGGEIVDSAMCDKAGVSLVENVVEPNYSTCSHSWSYGAWGDPGASCTANEAQYRAAWCKRDLDDQQVDDGLCDVSKREPMGRLVADHSGCQPYWYSASGWSDWSSYCSASATRTREIGCFRYETACTPGSANYWSDAGGGNCYRRIDDAQCQAFPTSSRAGFTPASSSESAALYSSCTNSWRQSGFVDPGPNCGNETWTQAVTCNRDLDGFHVPDDYCNAGTRPASTDVRYDVSSCSYTAVNWSGWTYASTCSSNTTRTQTAQCRRGDGQIVDGSECTRRGVSLTNTEGSQTNYSTCTNSWRQSGFADPGASCGNETWTQAVTCNRDLDGFHVPDAYCNAGTRPASTDVRYDVSGCGYTAVNWTAWSWNSTCSANATRTQTAQCRRGDGQMVADAECTSRGVALSSSVTEANYSTCSNSWDYGAFTDPGASCGNETWTRTARCRRDLDNATMADGACGPRESLTDVRYDVSGCGYSAVNWTAWSWNSTCSANATRTQTAQCRRGDGQIVANAECTGRGVALSNSVTEANYSTCSNSWDYGAFTDPGASCGNETWTRTARCRRDLDNATMVDGACGPRDSLTDVRYDVSGCGYSAINWTAWSWNSTCSANATRTQTAQCRRGDGQIVADAECTNRGVSLRNAVTEANYSTCSNSWRQSGFADPGASCGWETWTQSVTCRRDLDNAAMPDSSCNASTRPASTDARYDVSGCGYSAVNWSGWSWNNTCSGSATRTQTAQCRRGDGAIVDNSECTNRGVSLTSSVTEANYSGCTYSGGSSQSACTNGLATQYNSCRRNQTGEMVSTDFCGTPASQTVGCSSYSWQTGGWGGFGACQPNNAQYQYRDVWCQQNNGGNISRVDGSLCTNAGLGGAPTNVNAQGCSYYTYAWTYAGATGWNSTCSASAQRTQQYYCRREQDGASVDGGLCAGGNPSYVETTGVYSGCGYTPRYGEYGACDGSNRYAPITSCMRSDGTPVGTAECTNRGSASQVSQACTLTCKWTRGGPGYGSSSTATAWGNGRMPTSMSTIPWVYYGYSTGGGGGTPDYISNAPNPSNMAACNPSSNGVYGTAWQMQRYGGGYPQAQGSQNFICSCSG